MPFVLLESPAFKEQRAALKATNEPKWKKVNKTLRLLAENPRHPGLHAHKWDDLSGPNDEDVWTVYVENHTPSAWRIFFYYPTGERNTIRLVRVEPHT